jgi:DNA-binding NarL/FixJ family response regulator
MNKLTNRQNDVFILLLSGLSNKDISRKLYISEATVKNHVTAILSSFNCRRRIDLIVTHYNQQDYISYAPFINI